MAKGAVAKEAIFTKMLEIFEGSFMYNNGKENDSDIIICDYYRESPDSLKRCRACNSRSNNAKDFFPLLFSFDIPFMVWNKMVKKRYGMTIERSFFHRQATKEPSVGDRPAKKPLIKKNSGT